MNQPPTNINYAIEAKLNPVKDALFIENANSPYANLLLAHSDNKDSAPIKKLAAALNSPEVKKFIEEKYKGAIVPCSDSSAFNLIAIEKSPQAHACGDFMFNLAWKCPLASAVSNATAMTRHGISFQSASIAG